MLRVERSRHRRQDGRQINCTNLAHAQHAVRIRWRNSRPGRCHGPSKMSFSCWKGGTDISTRVTLTDCAFVTPGRSLFKIQRRMRAHKCYEACKCAQAVLKPDTTRTSNTTLQCRLETFQTQSSKYCYPVCTNPFGNNKKWERKDPSVRRKKHFQQRKTIIDGPLTCISTKVSETHTSVYVRTGWF